MNVLVGCEFSGCVRDAFTARGHFALSCDLLPSETPGPHYTGDVRDILSGYHGLKWDLGIFHPPCTYLCLAGVRWLFGGQGQSKDAARWQQMEQGAAFFRLCLNAPIERVAVENPIPHCYARQRIGPYTQLIQPYQFGHGETKATCLWLRNLPPLEPTYRKDDLFALPEPTERIARVHLMPPGPDRSKDRSRFFTGIAKAMAAQWG